MVHNDKKDKRINLNVHQQENRFQILHILVMNYRMTTNATHTRTNLRPIINEKTQVTKKLSVVGLPFITRP